MHLRIQRRPPKLDPDPSRSNGIYHWALHYLGVRSIGLISLPTRPLEVLIAVSILISAIHALCPLFPGREPVIAAGFGLIHGLAFATTLQNLGVGAWQRLASISGFNLGIETMQIVVVAAVLPSLILLSRTSAYAAFRLIGATFAACASFGWILERVFGVNYSIDTVVDSIAQRGPWIAIFLLLASLVVHARTLRARAAWFDIIPVRYAPHQNCVSQHLRLNCSDHCSAIV